MKLRHPFLVLLVALLLAMPISAAAGKGAGKPGPRESSTPVALSSTEEGNATLVVVVNATGGDLALPFNVSAQLGANRTLTTTNGMTNATFSNLSAGNASLAPRVPAGWRLAHEACDAGTPSNVTLVENATTTCWFDVLKLATLVARVQALGGDASFPFHATGAGLPESFVVNTTNGTGALAFADLEPGAARSLAALVPANWTLASATCSTGTPANFSAAAGETVTCAFTYVRAPTLLVRLATRGGDGTFAFEPAATGLFPGPFALTSVNGTASVARGDLEWNGTYGVRAVVPSGWKLHGATCSSGTPDNFTTPPGALVACDFAFARLGEIRVRVLAQGGDATLPFLAGGNTTLPASFAVPTTGGQGLVAFQDVDPDAAATLAPSVPSGWRLSASSCSAGTPSHFSAPAGGNATCTFALTRLAEVRGIVYHDRDRDGVRESGEEGLSGRLVYADLDHGGTRDSDEPWTTTNESGAYVLADLAPGVVRVRALAPWQWTATAPTNATRHLEVAAGSVVHGVDFGNAPARNGGDPDDDRAERWSGPGHWRRALRDDRWDDEIASIHASSGWLMPAGYAADAEGAGKMLAEASKHCERDLGKLGCARLKFESRLLVLRLNLLASGASWDEAQKVGGSRAAKEYLGLGDTATWTQIVNALEAKAGTHPTREQYQWMRQVAQSSHDG